MFEPRDSSTAERPSFMQHDYATDRTSQSAPSSHTIPGAREIRIVVGSAFFTWLGLALFTFRASDQSLFHFVAPAQAVYNWCGSLGANAAASLFVLFGPAAWATLLFSTFVVPRPDMSRLQVVVRVITGLSVIFSAAGLFAVGGVPFVGPMTGGIVGDLALQAVQSVGNAGCALGYASTLVFSILIFMQLSLMVCARNVWRAIYFVLRSMLRAVVTVIQFLWSGSWQLWRRREVQEQVKNTVGDDSWTPSGGGTSGSDNFSFEMPKEAPQGPVNNLYEIEGPATSDEQSSTNKPWNSFMPEDNVEQVESVDLSVAQEEAAEDNAAAYMSAGGGVLSTRGCEAVKEDGVEIEEIAEAKDMSEHEGEGLFAAGVDTDAAELDDAASDDTQDDDDNNDDDDDTSYFELDGDDEIVNEVDDEDQFTFEPDASQDTSGVGGFEAASVDTEKQGAHEMTSEEEFEEKEDEAPLYEAPEEFAMPDMSLFSPAAPSRADDQTFMNVCKERGRILEEKLQHFGVTGSIVGIHPGPVITLYEYEPEVGNKVSKILALEDDLALSLKALSIRILAPVPGKSVVGFEIANETRESVMFSNVVADNALSSSGHALPLALGVDIVGRPMIADLAKMPHLLVAGATGAGKSVGMNVMLVSLLASVSPDKVRTILIDPKRLEFAPYADVPHLLFPIVTSPYEVAPVLKWVVQEMELRYELMAQVGVRNIADYHKLDPEKVFALEKDIGIRVQGMPYIVIMIDELADLMMVAGKEIETLIARIAQMARAAGIHMLVATQRPSVDVVTGLIKANFPSRIAFRVSTKIDSRTIIDGPGAEKLLGKGDMLYLSPSHVGGVQRLHGAYVTDEEINRLNEYLKSQRDVEYFSLRQVVAQHSDQEQESDPLYDDVRQYLATVDEISISSLQRKYRVGFNRSARLIEMLERDGYIAPAQGSKPRRVLRDQ